LISVPDQKPDKLAADERRTLLRMLQYQRDSFVRKVEDLDDASARIEHVASGTTLLWLTNHLSSAETTWVMRRLAGEDGDLVESDTLAGALGTYRRRWARVDAIVAAHELDDLCARMDPGDPPTNLRWVLTHLVQETARHAGHADILRELTDGQTGR
jgi:uncharacterized damage-inducible protein DinB